MRNILLKLLPVLVGLWLVAPVSLAEKSESEAKKPDFPTFGDWGHKCDKSPDGKQELCYVFQNVTKKDSGQMVLGVRLAYREGSTDPMIVVTVPLGSLLPPGAALTLEGSEPLKLTYFLCAQEGCTTIAAPVPDAMVKAMKKGEQAVVKVAAPNQQVVGLPLSLKGFTKAMASLKK